MKIKTPTEFQTFNDGILSVYDTALSQDEGRMPKEELAEKYARVPFEWRKVGLTRYWEAQQLDVEVSLLVRIPRQRNIHTGDVCAIEGAYYRIRQAQDAMTMPEATDLTLERMEADYDARPVP